MKILFLCIVFVLFIWIDHVEARKKVVCYYASWSHYRKGKGHFDVENIDTSLCTHIIYSFILLNGTKIFYTDKYLDSPKYSTKNMEKFVRLKENNPNLKVMVSIGGWNAGSAQFSRMAQSSFMRTQFAANIVYFLRSHKFDGIDIKWEYPAQREGSSPKDKKNFVLLLEELKYHLDKYKFILTAAVGSDIYAARKSYDVKNIVKHVDFINLMTYSLHGAWNYVTGHNAPLYSSDQMNIYDFVSFWLSKGVPPSKLILGIPMFGRTYKLKYANQSYVGATSIGPGTPGKYTKEPGVLGYNEICMGNWQRTYDYGQQATYAVKGDQWVGFDDPQNILQKTALITENGLGGAMVWSIDVDDFKGLCGDGPYPLLKTINHGLYAETVKTFSCQGSGLYEDSSDDTKYYNCANNLAYSMKCSSGKIFNPISKNCVWFTDYH